MTATTAERYVPTKAAQHAVEGHETEILGALGIPWRESQRGHITCPFPGHGGTDDWRWDASKRKGYCTCKKGFSIFDAVTEMDGCDIEGAKLRCVEIIGRDDLIRTKSGEDGAFQKTDAASLLSAPAARRDDTLPGAYLAHRLGVEAAAVLMPTTPVVGFQALAYFDPPKGKGTGKPVKAGEWPCAVFGTVDAEKRQHAHRIYLAPGGNGKADLGTDASGYTRDPKKSAKRVGEESTAGRSVIWGDPSRSPWCIVAEGIETAAAVAYAFRVEIEAGEVTVASAINANGIEAFTPWPATKRVTIAADRDEAAKITRPNPTRRGERAARVFGIRNRTRVTTTIAIAGTPGTSADWLDIHAEHGAEAVRAGILAAVAYTPTPEEIKEERERTEGVASLRQVERDYPLPTLDSFKLAYQRTEAGRIKVHQFVKVGDEIVPQPIATPFGVVARLRHADDGDTYGLRLVVEDMGGKRREIDVDRAAFARQGAADTRAMLFEAGMRSENDGELIAVKALKAADPEAEIVVFRRPGWHELAGVEDRFFVCPSGRVIGAPADSLPELSVNARIRPAISTGGTLEGWKTAVGAAASVPRCEHWIIGTIAGFAAPLLSLVGLDTCGVNLSGITSGGKTTAQRLAVSVWCRAALDQRDSLLQSARATANGVEMMAARSNGSVLAMDELGHVNGKELGKIIYSLASGVGKARMTADAQLRASHTWSTFIILSAEKSLEEKVRGDGGEWYGGMAARIPDIDISGVDRAVDHAVMAKIQAVDRNFGHAGPAFVEAMIEAGIHQQAQTIRAGINTAASKIAGEGADGAMVRAASPFAILLTAGRMARQFGLLPAGMDIDGAIRWAWERFQKSTDAVALDPETQAVTNLRAWVAERWGSDIQATDPEEGTRATNRNALGWYDDRAVYIPAHRIVEAAGGTLKEAEIGRALHAQGLIAKAKDHDCFFVAYVPRVGRVKAYALRRDEFRMSAQHEVAFAVHSGGRA
ncbi:DUF927 domain-containing protein [Methylobacterium sp. WL12]|uniref:DUF927 domain-containing protein n=1 Tax=Methylobacterium sp. WL12 TaxID=2603890 RepID=UPI0011C8D012|nr:DUF927 domain-containing protein [Methylobacterium sp. WL12]TXM66518.1 DUF927 domain-containing protein [Methylobacterium sp. WL12]